MPRDAACSEVIKPGRVAARSSRFGDFAVWPLGNPWERRQAPCIDIYGLCVRSSPSWGRRCRGRTAEETPRRLHRQSTAAGRVQEITDVVLQNHIDPPARQQMVLSGIRALHEAAGLPAHPGLGRRVSTLTTPEQFASLIEEALAAQAG